MNDINDKKENNFESTYKVYKDKLLGLFTSKEDKTNQEIQKSIQENNANNSLNQQSDKLPKYATTSKESPTPTTKDFPDTPPIPPKPQETIKTQTKPIISKDNIYFAIKVLLILIITFILGYSIVNFQALSLRINYWYNTQLNNQNWSNLHPVELKQATTTAQKLDENYLYIPTIGIQAPINWGITQDDVNNMLSSGLVHYLSSALPDEASGNIYITGNTSGPIWSSSQYKTIFTLLDKAEPDQVITIIYDNNIYSFKIIEINNTSNNTINISTGIENNLYLNLLARYPVGLNWKTLIVKAELYKIESNILQSQEDKIEDLPETINDVQLQPIEVSPTTTTVPIPTNNNIPDPEILPDHFLPNL